MSFFNPTEPLFRPKQTALDLQDMQGLIRIHWQVGGLTLFSSQYTRIDQIFILWGLLAGAMFVSAQLLPIAWTTQAICWSLLTLVGTVAMVVWSWYWTGVERLRWLIWSWVGLIGGGILLTDWGIFAAQPLVMAHLCQLWLGLSAICYVLTGLGLRSRSLNLVAIAHLLGCAAVNHTPGWQFLLSGLVMATSLLLLGEYQWDMRPPSQFSLLSEEELEFNRQQHVLRQTIVPSAAGSES
jgi:hypothetical protein